MATEHQKKSAHIIIHGFVAATTSGAGAMASAPMHVPAGRTGFVNVFGFNQPL